jgi:ParB family chromosome partitioning protein
VSNTIKLLELPDAITDGLVSGKISEGHARALASIENEEMAVECYKLVIKEKASVRRTEDLARRYKEQLQKRSKVSPRSQVIQEDERVKDWEKGLNRFFQVSTKLKLTRSKNQTRVTITLKGTPEATEDDLEKIMEITG